MKKLKIKKYWKEKKMMKRDKLKGFYIYFEKERKISIKVGKFTEKEKKGKNPFEEI